MRDFIALGRRPGLVVRRAPGLKPARDELEVVREAVEDRHGELQVFLGDSDVRLSGSRRKTL
jgi:hypothetical protein